MAAFSVLPAGRMFAGDPLIELRSGKKVYTGKLAVASDDECWLLGRDGRLLRFDADQVLSRKPLGNAFRGFSSAELRDQLRRELGGGYDVAGTEHYLVAATKGTADKYAPLFEEIFRSFRGHFSVRGFSMKKPEFPLVAIVYPSQTQFAQQCREDHVPYVPGLLGYYHPASNRVAVYVQGEQEVSQHDGGVDPFERWTNDRSKHPFGALTGPAGTGRFAGGNDVRTTLRDTIVHETAHQVAFNSGMHPRIGETPRWLVEGLATVFEAPGVRDGGSSRDSALQRVNRERFVRFGQYAKSRRRAGSLKSFLSNDELLQQSPLDFYAQAWALSFFLIETRSAAYHRYLQKVAERTALSAYAEKDRLDDFEKAFGRDAGSLEAEFLRYMSRLQTPHGKE